MRNVYEITFFDGCVWLQRAQTLSEAKVLAASARVRRGSVTHKELEVVGHERRRDLDATDLAMVSVGGCAGYVA